jgi:uncharacterized RDD family membrane protein YckC
METVKVSTSQNIDIDYAVAGLGERITARLIDLAIFVGVYLLAAMLTWTFGAAFIVRTSTAVLYGMMILYAVAFVFYSLLCEIFMNGQSIGKRMTKIKVISIDGSQPNLGQYAIRWVFRLVDFWLTAQVGGLVCVAISDKKQRIGDIVAGTTVIKTIPRTGLEHIAFHPTIENYVVVYPNIHLLTDRDIELIHEVLKTFYHTANYELIENLSIRVAGILEIPLPERRQQLEFLNTVIKDYNHQTSASL